jgi:phosphoenolpyruvate carboxykinase (ATP)
MSIIREQQLQPLIVNTGQFTGRSPKDRYFVKSKKNENVINWGLRNRPVVEKTFDEIYQKIQEHLFQDVNFAFKGNVISDSSNSYEVDLLTEEKWYTKFAKNIFRNDSSSFFIDTIRILHAPSFNLKKNLMISIIQIL